MRIEAVVDGRGHRGRLTLVASLALLAAMSSSTGAGAATQSVRGKMRPVGPASVSQGRPFEFTAMLKNSGHSQVVVQVVFRLVDVDGGAGSVDARGWRAAVPGQGKVTATLSMIPAQWFATVGTFEVQALIEGQPVAPPLDFEVTPSTVAVPTFQDVTAQAGLVTTLGPSQCGGYSAGAAWADVDGNGSLDLYVPGGADPAQLWINDGTGHFTDQAASRGVTDDGGTGYGATFADYDNDGHPDLFVANSPGPDRLYHNDGTGHFTDVAAEAGVATTTSDVSASWGDYDADGYLDLYVVSNSPCLPPDFYEQDHLYHNNGDGTFSDVTSFLPAASTFGAGYQAAWFDYNGDGRPDLYLANDWWGPSPDRNHLWRNDGAGLNGTWTFTDVSAQTGLGYRINSMGIGIGDVNGDLLPDVAISNIGGNVVAENNGDGTFTDAAAVLGLQRADMQLGEESQTWGLDFADLNLDGREDLVVAAGTFLDEPQPDEVFTAAGDGTFLDLSAPSGAADLGAGRGIAIADYDRDGLLDLYTVNKAGSPVLYHNVTSGSGHWLEVDLTGTVSNRDGCGAHLLITTASGQQVRELFCGSVGLSSGNDTVVHFGLGTDSLVQTLEVDWPSGTRQIVTNVPGDQLIDVTEPG